MLQLPKIKLKTYNEMNSVKEGSLPSVKYLFSQFLGVSFPSTVRLAELICL